MQDSPNSHRSFKIVISGDAGVGKTTFVKRHKTGEFTKNYIATLGVEVHPFTFYTNKGEMRLNIWDTAGQERFGGLRTGYYINADGAIIMFDTTRQTTFDNVSTWIRDFKESCPTAPVYICGNKSDLSIDNFRDILDDNYCLISSKSNSQFEMPFLHLLRKLTNEPDLIFIAGPAVEPPEVSL